MTEPIYTPAEIAERLQLSPRTVQDLFRHEAGVLRIGNQRPGRRERAVLRIPASVVERVLAGKRVR